MHLAINLLLSAGVGGSYGAFLGDLWEIEHELPIQKNIVLISSIALNALAYFSLGLVADRLIPQGGSWSFLKGAGQACFQLISFLFLTELEKLGFEMTCDALKVKKLF